ncbi:MAG: C4-type zinc ribbon domain-containing protein [Lentisphaeraceae bacterium]|nr:C4-type zinc ribbon domain-containing protein [Lentisphaeraceae bacterium]
MGPLSTLLKIQDLELVLKESSIVHPDIDLETEDIQAEGEDTQADDILTQAEDIQAQIDELKKNVPERQFKQYDKVKKNGLGIAQEIQGRCKACHMAIPIGTITSIQAGKSEPLCPSCNVYIFLESFGEDD